MRVLAATPGLDDADLARRKVLLDRFVAGVQHDDGLRWAPGSPADEAAQREVGLRLRRAPEAALEDAEVLGRHWPWMQPPHGMARSELDELLVLSGLAADRKLTLYLVEP